MKFKSSLLKTLLILVATVSLILPFQAASAASLPTTTNPLTISMVALAAPARGFSSTVLLNGVPVQYGLSVIGISATIKGAFANADISSTGKITIGGTAKGTYCATLSVSYSFGITRLTASRRTCHTY